VIASDELSDLVRARARELAGRVRADGHDAHQVATDHLSWSYAHVEAARATREWANATGNELAGMLATAAGADAAAFLHGRGPADVVADGLRCAEIAARFEPLHDLGAGAEHRLLRSSLRQFVERTIAPHAQRIHREDRDVPEDVIRGIAELGLFGVSIPERYGGWQQDRADDTAMLIASEELSRGSLIAGSLITRGEILVQALVRAGTEEQKRRWLPAIAGGRMLVAVAVTEPDHGSDVASLRCRAVRGADGGWAISGSKLWCTFAGRAELLMILCRTGEPGRQGLSLLVVEKPAFAGHSFEHRQEGGGSLVGRAIPTIGYRGLHTFELVFDRYEAPAGALVGGDAWLDRGFELQMAGFSAGRLQTAGRAIGVTEAAFERALEYAKQRRLFGRSEFDLQLVRAKLGMMAVRLYASRQLSYRAARLRDDDGQVEASLAKLYAARAAELVTRESMQLHGAMGYAEETDISRYFVDARVLAIFEGAEEVLSLRVIGRALLDRA
jgi:(2S)-methylsuccinyl-CoA dehydrogenase